eukprot:m.304917 g.304917  ORF g.304917 m.304917 type:complete len:75 (+) comp27335_c1_seq2:382-606(+)
MKRIQTPVVLLRQYSTSRALIRRSFFQVINENAVLTIHCLIVKVTFPSIRMAFAMSSFAIFAGCSRPMLHPTSN